MSENTKKPVAESAISLEEFQKEMNKLNEWAKRGCTNHGCQIEPPKGMGTNSTCQCTPRAFAEHLLWLACELDKHGKYGRWPNAPDEVSLLASGMGDAAPQSQKPN